MIVANVSRVSLVTMFSTVYCTDIVTLEPHLLSGNINAAIMTKLRNRVGRSDKVLGFINRVVSLERIIDNVISDGNVLLTVRFVLETLVPKVGMELIAKTIAVYPTGILVDMNQFQNMIIGGTYKDGAYTFSDCACVFDQLNQSIKFKIMRFIFKHGKFTCICHHVCIDA